MVRLHITAEGQAEEGFVKFVITNHLGYHSVSTDVRLVFSGRRRRKTFRGGMLASYQRIRNDMMRWMKEDHNPDARFTTLFDLYALPHDFPGFDAAKHHTDPYLRIAELENALAVDIGDNRFVPYIQLHEFEALLLADPVHFGGQFPESGNKIDALVSLSAGFKSRELINDGKTTAPSKRIIAVIPEYEGSKASAGPSIAKSIGLAKMRAKCPRFNEWVTKLENV